MLAAADELGLRVPDDLSVVGYDNTVFARLLRLSLTTIDSHIAEVGQVAGRTLTARLDGDSGTTETRLLSPALVIRSSTGPPPPHRPVALTYPARDRRGAAHPTASTRLRSARPALPAPAAVARRTLGGHARYEPAMGIRPPMDTTGAIYGRCSGCSDSNT